MLPRLVKRPAVRRQARLLPLHRYIMGLSSTKAVGQAPHRVRKQNCRHGAGSQFIQCKFPKLRKTSSP